MKKGLFFLVAVLISLTSWGQSSKGSKSQISLRSADRAECIQNDFSSLKATFSFSNIESHDIVTERGNFSIISMANTIAGGNDGDPMIPVVNELIAIPFGATPTVSVKSYSSTDYRLDDYDIRKLYPHQPSLRKDIDPKDVAFAYNESAYQTRGLCSEPRTSVSVEGVMRGIRIGKLGIEPVSYDPVSNTLRVFNDIEVEVNFEGADATVTEDMLVKTYSPYFLGLYKQMFNGRAIMDAYTNHPDLYATPVRMMVITTQVYANEPKFQEWVNWKKQKGIYTDVYTTAATGTTASNIRSFIQNKYNQGVSAGQTPTFLVIVGDDGDVAASATGAESQKKTDLYYASTDNDIFPDIYQSRMPVSSTVELLNLLSKILTYEQFTMSDPSYLDNALLVAGWDATYTAKVGRPTIQYAMNYYYNTEHGFSNVYHVLTTGSGQDGQYDKLSSGVGFANYTAHGSETSWSDPYFSVSSVSGLSNYDKYFWAMGNCCLAADWGYNSTCFAEALLRAQNKGAFGYIGSCPSTYWYEDYFFGVGATAVINQMPTQEQTEEGVYDAIWDDDEFNTLNAVPYFGNVAVTYSHANNYAHAVNDQYYWEAYHCLGDGSVMPYHVAPSANVVSHANVLSIGATSFTVDALPGSYVAITKDNEIIGVALVGITGIVDVPITPVLEPGDIKVTVTRQQRQPYVATIQAAGGTQYNISITANPNNGGTVTGAGQYYENTSVTVTATPNLGYIFANWKENNHVVSSDASYTFTVSGNRNLVAQFQSIPKNNITYASVANGTVSGPTQVYPTETVTLTATPDEDYGFASWNVYKTGQPGTTVTVTNNQFTMPYYDVTVSANFGRLYDITLASSMNGSFTSDKNNALSGEIVTLTATPVAGYGLNNWRVFKSDDIQTTVNVSNNQFVMPDYDVTISAYFGERSLNEISIGSGINTNIYLPTYCYYKYSLTQQIYTAEEVGEAGSITSIAFYNDSYSATRNIDIYLKHTSKNTFSDHYDWESISSTDLVFSGSVTFTTDDWTTITFDTPFEYNGINNLVVCIDDNTGQWVGYYPAFYSYPATSRSIRIYSDDTNYVPTSANSYNGTIDSSNSQIRFKKIVSGNDESISLSPNTLSGFTYSQGFGPSESMPLNVVAYGLAESLTATAPSHFEVCSTANGTYSNEINIAANNGEVITSVFVRLKNGLVEGTYENETLTLSGDNATQTVTLNGEVEYGIPIPISQNYNLTEGWCWWSSYIELGNTNALGALQEELGANASIIKSQDAFNMYSSNLGWAGNLDALTNEKMYKIDIEGSCNISLTDYKALPEDHPITLSTGWNWIGYIADQPMAVSDALTNLTPSANDIIKGYDGFATYYSGFGWWGTLATMEPGKGYMYRSFNNGTTTLTYPTPSRSIEITDNNSEQHHWKSASGRYADNLNVIAILEDGHESDEIGAFVNGECRGSAIMHYFEPTGQYIAMLTIYGNENDVITLKTFDDNEAYDINETILFSNDLVVGSLSEPMLLTRKNSSKLILFPNPVEVNQDLHIEIPSCAIQNATLEVIDALGNIVRTEKITSNRVNINGLATKGIYTIRIISESGEPFMSKIVVR